MNDVLHVLYAEDNPNDADLTEAHFSVNAPEFTLDVVHTGEQCLARLQDGTYDVLLLDNRLPDMDGMAVLKHVGAKKIRLPVVMVTAAGDEALVVQLLRMGASDYVPKHGSYIEALPSVLKHAVTAYRGVEEGRFVTGPVEHGADIDLTLAHFADEAPHFTVEVVRSAGEAISRLEQEQFDLVLADLRMPTSARCI